MTEDENAAGSRRVSADGPGGYGVTSHDVARRAGVSRATVSAVINGTRRVSPKTVRRVLVAFEELNYQPNPAARALRGIPARRVGLMVANSASPFWGAIVKSVETTLSAVGFRVILCDNDDDPEVEAANLRLLSAERVDGILLASTGPTNAALVETIQQRLPIVGLARPVSGTSVDAVFSDNVTGGTEATRHLIALGRRSIACIGARLEQSPTRDRLAGYRAALTEAGIEVDERLIRSVRATPEAGYDVAMSLLADSNRRPDAFFVLTHLQTFGVLKAARDFGIGVPSGLSVIAYDDMPWAAFTTPPLTVVAQEIPELGAEAATLLLARIRERLDGQPRAPRRELVLPVHLIDRGSCGPRKLHPKPVRDALASPVARTMGGAAG